MPIGIAHKVAIVAGVNGLLLQQAAVRNQRSGPAIQITYATNKITTLEDTLLESSTNAPILDVHGIVGLFTVASSSYLISISSRRQVAQIRGKPIFVVTGVALIPLSSQVDAKRALDQSIQSLKKQASVASTDPLTDSETSEDEDGRPAQGNTSGTELDDPTIPPTPEAKLEQEHDKGLTGRRSSTIVEDVIGRKGQYGRFAERWFSKKGWSVERRRMQGMSADEAKGSETTDSTVGSRDEPIPPIDGGEVARSGSSSIDSLIPKLLKTTKILFNSNSFYFSYEYDITRRLGANNAISPAIPLYKSVDPLFFWNRHLASSFLDSGNHSFIVPLMQGFIGQRVFEVNTASDTTDDQIAAVHESVGEVIELQNNTSKLNDFRASPATRAFLITLISRRSTLRPGLRYLRRGVDDDGNTANTVETEQILSDPSWSPARNIYSFTQIRGSIPLYFSQSPYSLKPVPVLQHSYETNHAAFKRHFKGLASRYGSIQIASLVDKHGVEANIGEEYVKHTTSLNEEIDIGSNKVGIEWFDFHNICRGMKFENVSILMDSIGSKLDEFGMSMETDEKLQKSQTGILRTNCMDCLDRTNVVQSACGQRALEQQLKLEGITLDLQTDTSTQWFNTLWADNGDAISKQYSSTAALKGDFTRTRKRDYRGAINDLGLTLSRYFNNIFNDWFSQAAIDFLLGNVTDQVFAEFEADMMSADPAVSVTKLRQNAIETSSKIVIEDKTEELVGGWALLCPRQPNTLRTFPFEEAILLLTDTAIYSVRFDWNMEKVSGFERIDVRNVVKLKKGVYVTSTLAAAQTNEQRNIGLVITYRPGDTDVVRMNTRSLSTAATQADLGGEEPNEGKTGKSEAEEIGEAVRKKGQGFDDCDLEDPLAELKILAFKAPPSKSISVSRNRDGTEGAELEEKETVRVVCEEIARVVTGSKKAEGLIVEGDIISLAEAKKNTGLIEQLGHSLKKLVWA